VDARNCVEHFELLQPYEILPRILYRKPTAKISRCKNKSYRPMFGFRGALESKNYQGAAVKFPYWAEAEGRRTSPVCFNSCTV
jgi:hypothetical protein